MSERPGVAEKAKETAKEELENFQRIAKDGVRSGAYIYPFKVSINALNCDKQTTHMQY